jgi:hypothetical protein
MYSGPFRLRHRNTNGKISVIDEELELQNKYGPTLKPIIAFSVGGPLYASSPGDITKWMAVPWQTDSASCRSGYEAEYDPYLPTFWPYRVVIFFTDGMCARLFRQPFHFLKEINNTLHVSKRVVSFYSMIEGPGIVLSNTSILDKLVGQRWLSVGDAAVAHDPISSYGLIWSLKSSVSGASAITNYLDGDRIALEKYQKDVKFEFNHFTDRLKKIYRLERRFLQCEYWNRF